VRIRLQDGLPVELLLPQGNSGSVAMPPLSSAWIEQLYAFIFAQDKQALRLISQGQSARGGINIPNVGKIALIAQPQRPASLRLYLPPDGLALFESDWARLASPTMGPGPLPGAAPGNFIQHAPPPPPPVGAAHVGLALAFDPAKNKSQNASFSGFVPKLAFAEPEVSAVHSSRAALLAAEKLEASNTQERSAEKDSQQNLLATTPEASKAFVPDALPAPGNIPPAFESEEPEFDETELAIKFGGNGEVSDIVSKRNTPDSADSAPGNKISISAYDREEEKSVENKFIAYDSDAGSKGSTSKGENTVDAVLVDMVKRRASDLHLTTSEPICMRIDGEIARVGKAPLRTSDIASLIDPLFPPRNRQEFIEGNDTDFAYELIGTGRFRINIFRDRNGVGAVMRHIPSNILTAEQLNLPAIVLKFCQLSKGLVLVTGPTGSGKSTTLAAMIDLINKTRHDHILTVEDPIEFVHPQQLSLVNQREVHRHTKTFARALRAALREDPDIVLIGEMRDLETVAIGIETAETGHLVFGTLHTTTAMSTVERIVNQFPTTQQEQIRMMLASSLKGVVAQTLLKKKTGGRIAALEILVVNDAVSSMIRDGKLHMLPGHMQSQKGDGNVLLNEALAKLVKDNIVDVEEAMRKAVDKNNFIETLKRLGVKLPPGVGGHEKPAFNGKQSA
jgi:twitching motility protein PilT